MDKKVINYIPHFKYISEELEKEISKLESNYMPAIHTMMIG
jgi:hypothetical protein